MSTAKKLAEALGVVLPTPGPWEAAADFNRAAGAWHVISCNAGPVEMHAQVFGEEHKAHANALLIAAAPELRDALHAEYAWWTEELSNCNGDAVLRAARRLSAIGAALAKLEKK